MLGQDQPLILHLLDIPAAEPALKGVDMELQDCAFPLVVGMKNNAFGVDLFLQSQMLCAHPI